MTILESFTPSVRVDVRLCGGIPRQEMKTENLDPDEENHGARCWSRLATSTFGSNGSGRGASTLPKNPHTNFIHHDNDRESLVGFGCGGEPSKNSLVSRAPTLREGNCALAPVMEPPSWAVPARGEASLEPVCESVGRQCAIALTGRAAFRIGRSPLCDIPLFHATSSRRHAMLFHHSNGNCYVVDCGSAHGTYVNGVRVASPWTNSGVVLPHRVRRGALIRFGGPGAPVYVLKSFSFRLDDLNESRDHDGTESGELLRRNTRLNALGETAKCVVQSYWNQYDLTISQKRSFDSFSSQSTLSCDDEESLPSKRMRCSSPPLELEVPTRVVSPDLPSLIASRPRRVRFNPAPPQCFFPVAVTPDVSDVEDNHHSHSD